MSETFQPIPEGMSDLEAKVRIFEALVKNYEKRSSAVSSFGLAEEAERVFERFRDGVE